MEEFVDINTKTISGIAAELIGKTVKAIYQSTDKEYGGIIDIHFSDGTSYTIGMGSEWKAWIGVSK